MVCGRVLPSYLITCKRGWWVVRPRTPIDNNEFEVRKGWFAAAYTHLCLIIVEQG